MGNRGRFGKYGEKKRIERLRQVRNRPGPWEGLSSPERPHRRREPHRGRFIVVRPARISDAPFIRSLSRRVFYPYGHYEDLLPEWFLSGLGVTFLALLREKPAGYAMLKRLEGGAAVPKISELLAIAVEPWARRCGVGDRLMHAVIREADLMGLDRLILHTAVENLPGQGLFQKQGFTPCGVKKGFYPEGQDALMMERACKGVQPTTPKPRNR